MINILTEREGKEMYQRMKNVMQTQFGVAEHQLTTLEVSIKRMLCNNPMLLNKILLGSLKGEKIVSQLAAELRELAEMWIPYNFSETEILIVANYVARIQIEMAQQIVRENLQ